MNLLGVQTDKLQAQGQTRKGTVESGHPFTPIGVPTSSRQSLKKPILFGDLDNRGSTAKAGSSHFLFKHHMCLCLLSTCCII